MSVMTSNKSYLIRAIYDWILDNELTPYLLVNAEFEGVQVPWDYVNLGKIVLNISPKACRGLHLENDRIVFTARFAGIAHQIYVIPSAVLAIYAKENGRGMEFDEEEGGDVPPPTTKVPASKNERSKPSLKLVK
jgi:stringent starvation protein B